MEEDYEEDFYEDNSYEDNSDYSTAYSTDGSEDDENDAEVGEFAVKVFSDIKIKELEEEMKNAKLSENKENVIKMEEDPPAAAETEGSEERTSEGRKRRMSEGGEEEGGEGPGKGGGPAKRAHLESSDPYDADGEDNC
jgi:hypothetical protein